MIHYILNNHHGLDFRVILTVNVNNVDTLNYVDTGQHDGHDKDEQDDLVTQLGELSSGGDLQAEEVFDVVKYLVFREHNHFRNENIPLCRLFPLSFLPTGLVHDYTLRIGIKFHKHSHLLTIGIKLQYGLIVITVELGGILLNSCPVRALPNAVEELLSRITLALRVGDLLVD